MLFRLVIFQTSTLPSKMGSLPEEENEGLDYARVPDEVVCGVVGDEEFGDSYWREEDSPSHRWYTE